MVYQFKKEIVNHSSVDNFFDSKNFVGYILPDGTIFRCKNHNLSDANTVLMMSLMLLDSNYDRKEELLSTPTNNELSRLIAKYLKNMSHEKIHALLSYIQKNNIFLSDLLVSFFDCHLITRLDKEILTSATDYNIFYNYLLNDFTITNVGKIIYDAELKEYRCIHPVIRNDELYDEIKKIKNESKPSEIDLFYKMK